MDKIPTEILYQILDNLKILDPKRLYKLRRVNKFFKTFVDDLINNYNINYTKNNIQIQNLLNRLFWSNQSLEVFKWFFKNNIFLTENNVTNLILNGRIDILNECLNYNSLLDVLFKNNYNFINQFPSEKLVLEYSPLIIAGKNNKYDIVKYFLEAKILKNPYFHHLDELINECIKLRNISIIKYVITHYYKHIKSKSITIVNIIKQLNNIEDIVFYLIECNKCVVTSSIVLICIDKGYTDICKYIYKRFYSDNDLVDSEMHTHLIIKKDNIELLNYFLNMFPKYKTNINYELKKNIKISENIFRYIYDNYREYLDRDSNLIYYYLLYFDNLQEIKQMVDEGFMINKLCLQLCLDNNKKEILKYLVGLY